MRMPHTGPFSKDFGQYPGPSAQDLEWLIKPTSGPMDRPMGASAPQKNWATSPVDGGPTSTGEGNKVGPGGEATPARDEMMEFLRDLIVRGARSAEEDTKTSEARKRTVGERLGQFKSKPMATADINARRRQMNAVTGSAKHADTTKVHEIGRKNSIARNLRKSRNPDGTYDTSALEAMGATEAEIEELIALADNPELADAPGAFRRGQGPTRTEAMDAYGEYKRNQDKQRDDEVWLNSQTPNQGVSLFTDNQREFINRSRIQEGKKPLLAPRSPRDLTKPGFYNRNPEIPLMIENAVSAVPRVDSFIDQMLNQASAPSGGGQNLPMPPRGQADYYRNYGRA
jgi:hypothetical protein